MEWEKERQREREREQKNEENKETTQQKLYMLLKLLDLNTTKRNLKWSQWKRHIYYELIDWNGPMGPCHENNNKTEPKAIYWNV